MEVNLYSVLALLVLAVTARCSFSHERPRPWTSYSATYPLYRVLWNSGEENVIVGGRNLIFKFDKNLRTIQRVVIGPLKDHPGCPPAPLPCPWQRQTVDNDIKVILQVDEHVTLMCGTAGQGMCQLYNTGNLSMRAIPVGRPDNVSSYVAGRGDVVAFFAPAFDEDKALYTAVSYDGRPEALTGPSVSSRVIGQDESSTGRKKQLVFEYSYQDSTSVTAVSVHPHFRKHVRYLYGFSHEGFSYFLSTQRLGEDAHETRLGRVCQKDHRFFSYSELTLRCLKESASVYNLATAAYLGEISKTLRKARDLEREEKVLYVTFGRNDQGDRPLARYGSVVCMFPMSQLESAFANATRDCLDGTYGGRRIKSLLGTDAKCEKVSWDRDALNKTLCDPGINHYVEGREPVPGGVRARLREVATSVAVTLQGDSTVAFIGTANGSVIKFVLEKNLDQGELYRVPLDPDPAGPRLRVESSNTFDDRHENLYMLTGNKVVKFPAGSCSPHPDCRSCLKGKDPLNCGWCGDRCSEESECDRGTFQDSQCPPFIYKISPTNGHKNGGTVLTIEGDNLGSNHIGQSSWINITVAGTNCTVFSWEFQKIQCRTNKNTGDEISGPVVLYVEDTSYDYELDVRGNATSKANFTFVTPRLIGAFPWFGAMSGGTNVTLVGENLNIGSNQTVSLAGIPCLITANNGSHIQCTSGPHRSNSPIVHGSVLVWIDNNGVGPDPDSDDLDYRDRFDYRADPVIKQVEPRATTWSGGTKLLVSGLHLDSVNDPRMVVTVTHSVSGQQHEVIQSCIPGHPADQQLVCRTPPLRGVPQADAEPRALAPVRTHVSFLMDGVVSTKRFHHDFPKRSELLYYPDPVFTPFDKNVTQVRTDTMELVIKGMHLNLALRPEDVMVKVNYTHLCNITKLTSDSLYCVLPTHLNSTMVYNVEPQKPVPIVVLAGNQEFHLGGVTLVNPPEGLPASAVAGIALGVSLLLAFLFLVLYKRGVLTRMPFMKVLRRDRYVATYTADPATRNDYQDFRSGSREEQGPCLDDGPSGPRVSDETMHLLAVDNILISRDYLTLGKEIGQGHFGRVYRGELQLPGSETSNPVAVKTLHSCRYQDSESTESFLQEGLMMKDFRHQHVLTLIGVCFEDTGLPMVVLPFMKHGDLRSYIQDESNEPTIKLLIEFGIQVAEGMKYLSELKFVHRDLAARNCMLDEDLTVKVADFGLSRDVYERDYYSSDNKKSKLPVKWMAPESLEKGTYSTKSDVWSFGIVIWELMTRGVSPYPEVGNWEILNFIKAGRRMLQPSYCPDMLYKIMMRCWNDDPRKRPTFGELSTEIKAVIKKMENKHRKVGLNVTYVNVPSGSDEQQEFV